MLSRVKFVIGAFIVVGGLILLLHAKNYPVKTEQWMEAAVPEELKGYSLASSSKRDPSAKMDERTYDLLKPFGIVTRKYTSEKDSRTYDFVVIAGSSRKSFHDPVVCFSAQNWQIMDRKLERVNIPALGGPIPVTVMGLDQPGIRGTAMYFYKDPFGWHHNPLYIVVDLTLAKLLMKDSADAQFFRLIVWPATAPNGPGREALQAAQEAHVHALEQFANTIFAKLGETRDGKYFVQN